ncbi:hypothetical protein [Aquimarina agarilytica]|uniref:hypothetical protein n=1 Tax=Aquimarina agarilytica TaxID=1087449 RepID=UPI00028A31A3|nr:hypothetical protein [Aquimarina agarilytica]
MNNSAIKPVLTGVLVGFIATALGSILWIIGFSDMTIKTTIEAAFEENVIGAILAAGALLNIPAFFLFLKQHKNYQARGVMIATFIVAIYIVYKKFA